MAETYTPFFEGLSSKADEDRMNRTSPPASGRTNTAAQARQGSEGGQAEPAKRPDNPPAPRRSKYIPRACQDCQRRKVKCSGEDVCSHCRHRRVACIYSTRPDEPSRKRSRVASPNQTKFRATWAEASSPSDEGSSQSVEDRIARLQDRIRRSSDERPRDDALVARRRFTASNVYTLDSSLFSIEDTDTFDNGAGANNLSLSAQLLDLQKTLRIRAGVAFKLAQGLPSTQPPQRVFPLELPAPAELRRLLGICFRELTSFFPFLDPGETEARALRTIEALGYSEHSLIVDVDTHHHAMLAMLCNLLALGESYDVRGAGNGSNGPSSTNANGGTVTRPGWALYQRGRRLIQHCGSSRVFDVDLVRSHTLCCIYMMNSELLVPASHTLSTAVQIAMMLKLNDQSQWEPLPDSERIARQRLWWTIYFLDRRLSQRNGAPYMIHDHDVAVGEFRPAAGTDRMGPPGRKLQPELDSVGGAAVSDADKYLQSLIDFGRLWGFIWDTSYAAVASKGRDWKETVMTDTRIHIFRCQLPPELTWDTEKIQSYIESGEDEPRIRRRLAIFIRTNLLRMIIRQNPMLAHDADEEVQLFCARLARSSVDAIEAFASACSGIHACGYFISTALVECVYHVVYILQDPATLPAVDRRLLVDTFLKAYELLTDFAASWPTARRAVQALARAIFAGGDASLLFGTMESAPQGSAGPGGEQGNGAAFGGPGDAGNCENGLKLARDGDRTFRPAQILRADGHAGGDSGLPAMPEFDPALFASGAPTLTDLSNEILHGDTGLLGVMGLGSTDPIDFDYTHLFPTP